MLNSMIQYAQSFIGVPYKWGGNNPMEGMDCSGFVLEVVRSKGMDFPDMTAQQLFNVLKDKGFRSGLKRGSILFFGHNQHSITHVAIAVDSLTMIEAGGGNSKTTSIEMAVRQNAFVRQRLINSRKDLVSAIIPEFGG